MAVDEKGLGLVDRVGLYGMLHSPGAQTHAEDGVETNEPSHGGVDIAAGIDGAVAGVEHGQQSVQNAVRQEGDAADAQHRAKGHPPGAKAQ